MSFSSNDTTRSAFPVLDMMMNMQRFGLQAISAYQPIATAFLDSALAAQRSARPARDRSLELRDNRSTDREQVIGIGEEVLNVGTRMVPGKTTRVRRVVVENPVQQDVTLHTETVVLERRKPLQQNEDGVLTEVTVEMSDFNEVPVVSKSVHRVEEVLLRKEVTARIETVRDTVRRDKLEIDPPANLPVVFQPGARQEEEKKRAENPAPQATSKSGDQKRS